MALLTIITVTYNAEAYLRRTLESVKEALDGLDNPSLVEYLIVDGASKDATLSIASEYDFISAVTSEPDKGLYDAMNKGMAQAGGQYLWFLNAGDQIFDKGTITALIPYLEAGDDVMYSDALFVRDDGTEVGLRSQFTPHQLPEQLRWQDMALGMKVCHQAFLVRRTLAPYYDITNLSADLDWEIVCLKRAGKIGRLPFILCRYLLGGLSVQSHKKSLFDRWKVLSKHFGTLPAVWNHGRIIVRGLLFLRRKGKYW